MLNKRIRSLIDEIFSEMKMTAENLALRDELLANAQARYEDAVSDGKTEEEAFAEVASSLGDVRALLQEMNAQPQSEGRGESEEKEEQKEEEKEEKKEEKAEHSEDEEPQETKEEPKEAGEKEAPGAQGEAGAPAGFDLSDALNRAFSTLGGALDGLGKAVNKGMRDAQRAAGETIDRLSGQKGELVFDFGAQKDEKRADREAPKEAAPEAQSPEALLAEAKDIRAQAEIKQAVGDLEGARALRAQAYELETRAQALEQEQAMELARREAVAAQEDGYIGEDGEIDKEAFSKAVDDMVRDAHETAQDGASVEGERVFPAAGLRRIELKLDADDVRVEPASGPEIRVRWDGMSADNCPVVTMDGHTLSVRRPNPDVFKTFFSVFGKNGGQIVVSVPCGYAADYEITTTSGDIALTGVDADAVKVGTTSGDIRVEPDTRVRIKEIAVNTVSGDVTVSACVCDAAVASVSGDLFVSCDAKSVDANTVSGDVHIEGACDQWEVETVSGDAELLCTVSPARSIQINSVSGSALVRLPGDIRGFVAEHSGMSGHIENEFGPSRYGTCALPITMSTMSGNLTIARL